MTGIESVILVFIALAPFWYYLGLILNNGLRDIPCRDHSAESWAPSATSPPVRADWSLRAYNAVGVGRIDGGADPGRSWCWFR